MSYFPVAIYICSKQSIKIPIIKNKSSIQNVIRKTSIVTGNLFRGTTKITEQLNK